MKNYFQKIVTLFTGYDYPESTRQEFYRWLVDEQHISEKEEPLRQIWQEGLRQKSSRKEIGQSYELLRKSIRIPSGEQKRKIRPIHIWQAVAAVLFIIAASSVYLSIMSKDREDNLLQQYIPTAEMKHITLPDGSKVHLNSQSTLLYPQKFTGKNRSVFLVGEANFQVKPDKKHPFIVKSNDFQVTALGTEFNVSAYPENQTVATTLLSGSVLVEYNHLRSHIILKPHEQLNYNRSTRRHKLDIPDIKEVTAWQRGELLFREMTIKDIITVLERKYPYTFEYQLKQLKDDRYSFRFRNQASLSEVMDVIVNVAGNINYKIKGDRCYLIPK